MYQNMTTRHRSAFITGPCDSPGIDSPSNHAGLHGSCRCLDYNLTPIAITHAGVKPLILFHLSTSQVSTLSEMFTLLSPFLATSLSCPLHMPPRLTLILPRSRTGTVWFYTSTSNKRAARAKLYTKSLTGDLKLMYSRFTLVRISINL